MKKMDEKRSVCLDCKYFGGRLESVHEKFRNPEYPELGVTYMCSKYGEMLCLQNEDCEKVS